MIAIDLSKKQYSKLILPGIWKNNQQHFSLLKKQKENALDFSQRTVKTF